MCRPVSRIGRDKTDYFIKKKLVIFVERVNLEFTENNLNKFCAKNKFKIDTVLLKGRLPIYWRIKIKTSTVLLEEIHYIYKKK